MSGARIRGLDENRKNPFVIVAIMVAVIFLAAACTGGAGTGEVSLPAAEKASTGRVSPALGEALADMLDDPGATLYRVVAAGWATPAKSSMGTVYRDRGYRPLWIADNGQLTPEAMALADRLAHVEMDGLDPAAYRVENIHAAIAQGDVTGLSAAELMLSDALVRYSAQMGNRTHPQAEILNRAASADDFSAFLDALEPADPAYKRLRDAFIAYKAIVTIGGWETIPAGGTLRPGASDSRVPALRRRLALSGDLPEHAITETALYDPALEGAVKRFQARHGLTADGVIGTRSLEVLNVPAEIRAEQIAENLRQFHKPESRIGDRAIVVNIAAFELEMYEGGREVLRSRTVVGLPDWETPRIVSELQWLEINPTWSVPRRIAVEEIMPKLRHGGTEYLDKRGFRLFDAKWRELDSETMDLAAIEGDQLPFILRQDPGPRNPLGSVKFMFPNDEAIYLHDTPSRRAFTRVNRAVSHGCVRVEAAAELAMALLREEGWTQADYDKVVQSGKTYRVRLRNPMPIHIVTRTVWVDADNRVQFRNDPYAKGKSLQLALN